MNANLPNNTDYGDESLTVINMDDVVTNEDTSLTEAQDKQFNISTRRRIEEYLENKRLASQTTDYYFAD